MSTEVDESVNQAESLEDGELQGFLDLDGINVWGQHQSVLEEQALSHIQSLTESSKTVLEDGEVIDTEDIIKNNAKLPVKKGLDITEYLASQAKLKKNFVCKKVCTVSEKSYRAAQNISKRQNYSNINHKKKRKNSESNSDISLNKNNDEIEPPIISVKKKLKTSSETQVSGDLDNSGSEYVPSDHNSDSDFNPETNETPERKKNKSSRKVSNKVKDDATLNDYNTRLSTYVRDISSKDEQLANGLIVPGEIWSKLYTYQQEGVKWMWDLHQRDVGGLLGDEMGLGKTVQIIAFLAALQHTQTLTNINRLGPTIIVCPVTVVHQWVKHFYKWWPPFRILLLHNSSAHTCTNKHELIRTINRANGILVTNYESILKYRGILVELKWHYLILDEGHKIRNPTAKITLAVKQFRGMSHRLMLTGSPMQNNLLELWSLFDFIVPGRLGTQQTFMDHFATPIVQGGYTNATPTQETTALLIATSLKDMISPYMLRRSKNDVADSIYLPDKSEQVLFCSLTDEQRDLYKGYLLSDKVGSILGRTSGPWTSDGQKRANMLVAITTLRKICNHPDLYLGEASEEEMKGKEGDMNYTYGYFKRSGKMIVVNALLKIWKKQNHRVLLFTQSRYMLEIFEDMLQQQEYKYMKMDGTTTIANRQPLIDKFNRDSSYDVFLLTTRVGGLGVNLTGANRVIIYDPDWNPATDLQARERAWRIGQLKQVTVYRLLSAGTIEEKMYQRQVFKQLLSNKVLLDPRTHRFFKHSDLMELFSLPEEKNENPETANIFRSSKVEFDVNKSAKNDSNSNIAVSFSEDKIQAMKHLAQQISKKISDKKEKKDEKPVEKRPTPIELLEINRRKLVPPKPEPIVNKINDSATNASFSDVLNLCAVKKKINMPTEEVKIVEEKKKKEKRKDKMKIDDSGKVEGESVEGLVKIEIKKKEKVKKSIKPADQDDYVLGKLFSKKGVQSALQHDVIVQSGYKPRADLKTHHEAKLKADKAVKALRKSRIDNWRW